nr:uncharacterized protein LOC128690222 [Cherax quadricarinatus]
MFSPGGQESYGKVPMSSLSFGDDDVLDDFDTSLLDEEYTVSPLNSGIHSPSIYHYEPVTGSRAGNTGVTSDSGDWRSYNESWTVGDAAAASQLATPAMWDSASIYLSQATAAEGWTTRNPVGGSNQSLLPQPSDGQTSSIIGRKLKVYELPPQSDPELEKKRLRAIKALKNRLKKSLQQEEKYSKLDTLTQDVSRLRSEKSRKQQTVAALQAYLSQMAISPNPQHTGKC